MIIQNNKSSSRRRKSRNWDNRGSLSFHDGAPILVGQAKKRSVLYRLLRFGDVYIGILGVGGIGVGVAGI